MKYQRFISYLYQYADGEKVKNTGYVKVEQKGSMTRISLRNKLLEHDESEYYIFLISRQQSEEQHNYSVLLDKVMPSQGMLVYQYIAGQDRGFGTYKSIDDFAGVLIRGSRYAVYMTVWQDIEIWPEQIICVENNVQPADAGINEQHRGGETPEGYGQDDGGETPEGYGQDDRGETPEGYGQDDGGETLERYGQDGGGRAPEGCNQDGGDGASEEYSQDGGGGAPEEYSQDGGGRAPEGCGQKETGRISDTYEQVSRQQDASASGIYGKEGDVQKQYEEGGIARGQSAAKEGEAVSLGADYLFKNRNPLPAVEGSQLVDCIRIEPQDLGLLPMRNWRYGNNSFLNHSYYRYRYLLLGKLKFQDDSVRIILGVPSIYTSKEKYLANMFGFEQFVTARRTDRKLNQFGYWLTELMS